MSSGISVGIGVGVTEISDAGVTVGVDVIVGVGVAVATGVVVTVVEGVAVTVGVTDVFNSISRTSAIPFSSLSSLRLNANCVEVAQKSINSN